MVVSLMWMSGPTRRTPDTTDSGARRRAQASRRDGSTRSRFRPSFPLVEAKLNPPSPRPDLVPRDRLVARLTSEPRPPVALVIGPMGYGKTSLLAQWVAREDRPVAWLTLDDYDNDPSVFLTYLAAAIDRLAPIDGSIRSAIAAHGSRLLATAVPRLAAELHRLGRPAALVLDDAHRLVNPLCVDALTALLAHLPSEFQIAIATRTQTELPVGSLRAAHALVEITRLDLAFDSEEAAALVSASGCPMGAEEVRALRERTEGWPAGIYLASLACVRAAHSVSPIEVASGRDGYIADYLRSEVMGRLPAEDASFLRRTSILEAVEPAAADAVAGLPASAGRLRALAYENQLITEIARSGGAFQYHTLLGEFLQAELERYEPELIPELHRRAEAWYSSVGQISLAIEHAFRAADMEGAASLFPRAFLALLYGGHGDRLDRWLSEFDDDAFAKHPPLTATGSWVHLLNGRPAAAEHLMDIAEGATFTGEPGDGTASFESGRAIVRAVMVRHGPEDMLANAAFAVSAEGPGSPWRTNALLQLGWAYLLLGHGPEADAALRDAVDANATSGSMVAWATRASLAIARRDWGLAEEFARASRHVLEHAQLGNLAVSLLTYATAARIAVHRGNVERARKELVLAQLVRPLATYGLPYFAVAARLELAHAYLATADPVGARNVVSEAEEVCQKRPGLGVLIEQVAEMRRRLSESANTLVGSSALSAAELRLLPMLSTPLTFKEIAERVSRSTYTVKSQAISIYGKFDASSRSEAVERAIEVGLLEPFPQIAPRPKRHSPRGGLDDR
jgi:LuxR family maltose regulon positive regulatory protein